MNSEDSKMVKLIDENITNCEDNINTNNYNNGNSNDVKLVQNDADHNQNEGKKENDNNLEDGKKTLKKIFFIELNEGISLFNLLSYYAVQFTYVCAFTFIDACQDYLLEDEKYYNIDKNKVGTINGDILFFDLLYLILFIHIYGSFHDVFGSKFLIVFGFISMGISLILYPMAGKIYPNLILVRLIFSNGICAVTTQPLLADYVNHRSKGFGGGIAAVVSGFGAIFAALFLLKLQSYIEISKVYWVSAVICFIVALICAFGVKNVQRATIERGSILNRL
jgi:MFS family permease